MKIDIKELIRIESSDVELKEFLEEKKVKDWLKSVSSFSNTNGGYLIWGVNDKTREITGVENYVKIAEKITQFIVDKISPRLLFKIDTLFIEKKAIHCSRC